MIFIALLFLTGCSWSNFAYQYVDQSASKYVLLFAEKCLVPVNSSVVLKDLPDGYFGHCENHGRNNYLNVVTLNKKFFESATETQREILVSHELGHCVLDRRHKEGLIKLGSYPNAPASLMYPTPFGYEPVFEENKSYYYNELCGAHI